MCRCYQLQEVMTCALRAQNFREIYRWGLRSRSMLVLCPLHSWLGHLRQLPRISISGACNRPDFG
jgi:hypothetical protein